HVVALGEGARRIGEEQILVLIARRGEGMMHRRPALALLVPLEHREVEYPQRPPRLLDELLVLPDLHPQRAERGIDDVRLVGAEENDVAVLRSGALEDLAQR